MRFTQLKKELPMISDKVLSDELGEMVSSGLLTRHVFAEVPLHVEYSLTQMGERMMPVLYALREWSDQHRDRTDVSLVSA